MSKYDKIADGLTIRFSGEPIAESDEIQAGIHLKNGKSGKLVRIKLLNFTRYDISLNRLIQLNLDEIVPSLIKYA